MEGTSACVLVDEVGSFLSGGLVHVWWCFWGCLLPYMILGSLCANGWGCVPVLLVVCHRVFCTVACWSLNEAESWH